ncbi:3-methyladenine DNA glycosylase [Rarobacter incanus]|uniref:3-methyladenine DNA glycosylase n=1 Tax=Rarobacter incanus TaxID=153494 RepID=A0A542SRP1_9MICO|nr:3-methyladenine DNA glycosylase [Rarobacter incanus]TQK77265.1 hypothetical protein FB389_1984 [Rarobacter incanus]
MAIRHRARADGLLAAREQRTATGAKDEVEDFLFTYYPVRPGLLRRWQPGIGVTLAGSADQIAAWKGTRWYASRGPERGASGRQAGEPRDDRALVWFDGAAFMDERADTVRWIHTLLTNTMGATPFFGCLGLHEWAMVYRQADHRHALPLRLGQERTDEVVDNSTIRCSHFDAFRFFTPAAVPLNTLAPSAQGRIFQEQPACLHTNMDLLRHALKLGPAVPGGLVLDCFELARDIRILDMEASPYDVTSRGYGVVAIETAQGRAQYISRQRGFRARADALRARLLEVTTALVGADPAYSDVRPSH